MSTYVFPAGSTRCESRGLRSTNDRRRHVCLDSPFCYSNLKAHCELLSSTQGTGGGGVMSWRDQRFYLASSLRIGFILLASVVYVSGIWCMEPYWSAPQFGCQGRRRSAPRSRPVGDCSHADLTCCRPLW